MTGSTFNDGWCYCTSCCTRLITPSWASASEWLLTACDDTRQVLLQVKCRKKDVFYCTSAIYFQVHVCNASSWKRKNLLTTFYRFYEVEVFPFPFFSFLGFCTFLRVMEIPARLWCLILRVFVLWPSVLHFFNTSIYLNIISKSHTLNNLSSSSRSDNEVFAGSLHDKAATILQPFSIFKTPPTNPCNPSCRKVFFSFLHSILSYPNAVFGVIGYKKTQMFAIYKREANLKTWAYLQKSTLLFNSYCTSRVLRRR